MTLPLYVTLGGGQRGDRGDGGNGRGLEVGLGTEEGEEDPGDESGNSGKCNQVRSSCFENLKGDCYVFFLITNRFGTSIVCFLGPLSILIDFVY